MERDSYSLVDHFFQKTSHNLHTALLDALLNASLKPIGYFQRFVCIVCLFPLSELLLVMLWNHTQNLVYRTTVLE